MFHDGDLQSGIALAVQQAKAVLCFVFDDTITSEEWEDTLRNKYDQEKLHDQVVALRIKAGSQEAGFLAGICPVRSTPAIILIRNAQLQANLQSDQVSTSDLESKLDSVFSDERPSAQDQAISQGEPEETEPFSDVVQSQDSTAQINRYIDLPSSSGRMRLPNNAYDAIRNQTQTMLDGNIPANEILETQLNMLNRIPTFRKDVERLRAEGSSSEMKLSDETIERLLRMPGAVMKAPAQYRPVGSGSVYASGPGSSINRPPEPSRPTNNTTVQAIQELQPSDPVPDAASDGQQEQRSDYVKMQKEREQKQRDERERIKAQIKSDREERRIREEMRKQVEKSAVSETSTPEPKPRSNEIRVQVRTFDGSTIRQSFGPTATLGKDIRSWIDSTTQSTAPYNLKLILTPLPNRNIETAEEEQSLTDLGFRGSATLVMVPVKGYVESYTGSTPAGLVGSAVSGGYNLVTGTAGALFGGVRSIFGYGQPQPATNAEISQNNPSVVTNNQPPVRVRTLADQRAEDTRKDQQFYNGNQLNFQPRKDDEDMRKND